MTSGLALDGLTKTYPAPDGAGRIVVMRDFTLQLAPGEFVCLVGHSGCGK
jgi:ABC-type nitrate/sulfonate/bicarbonate transport system ATPase subunit